MKIVISNTSDTPLYQQIKDQIMSIRRALLDTDPLLGRINVKDGHTVHPVGFFGG